MPRQNDNPESRYKFVAKLGSGAFADVIKALHTQSGRHFAIKKMKEAFQSVDQVQRLPELQLLKQLEREPFAVYLEEILFDRQTGKLALVLELMENNIYEAFKDEREPMPERLVQLIFFQCCCGVYELHSRGWMHRDVKPENYLICTYAGFVLVKIADFGSVAEPKQGKLMTEYISTRWYRAPEILLTDGDYSFPADIFALGCIFYELLTNVPLFAGKDELDQLLKEQRVIGVPNKQVILKMRKNTVRNPIKEQFTPCKGTGIAGKLTDLQISGAVDLIEKMISYDPDDRINIEQALRHHYFDGVLATIEEAKQAFPEENYEYLKNMCTKFVRPSEAADSENEVAEALKKIAQRKTRERPRKQQDTSPGTVALQKIKKHTENPHHDGKILPLYVSPVEPQTGPNMQINLPQIVIRKK